MFSFAVSNGANYCDQRTVTALWDELKKTKVLLQIEQIE